MNLFVTDSNEHILLLSIHHIISDFWSLGILLNELSIIYGLLSDNKEVSLPAVSFEYTDFANWQNELVNSEKGRQISDYWENKLGDSEFVLNLPLDKKHPVQQSFEGSSINSKFDAELTSKVNDFAKTRRATPYMVLLSAFQSLLFRYTSQTDILTGTPASGRTQSLWAETVGYFVNPLVIRSTFSDQLTFDELLSEVKKNALEAYQYQNFPFPVIVEKLQPERDPSYSPIFQVMFILQKNQSVNDEAISALALGRQTSDIKLNSFELESFPLEKRSVQFDLTLEVTEIKGELHLSFHYSTALFEKETIERMSVHFENLLREALAKPDKAVSLLKILTSEETFKLLNEWNDTSIEFPKGKTLHALFAEQVKRTPDAIAVVDDNEQITYAELNRRANKLGNYLRKAGIAPDVCAGVLLERNINLIVALLGILKAGGAYVPLDPHYPQDRIKYMLEDSSAQVLITQSSLTSKISDYKGEILCVDELDSITNKFSGDDFETFVTEDNLGYLIYTSGSTGKPKGVMIAHKSACTLVYWTLRTFSKDALSAVLGSTSICFDLSVYEIFATLSGGGKLILVLNALELISSKHSGEVTLINTVPSAMTELVRLKAVGEKVKVINLAGEALPGKLVKQIYEQNPQVEEVWNLYGPSEDTTYSTWSLVEKDLEQEPKIGRPLANTQAYILDKNLNPVPIGAAGEIYLSGDGLARGYKNRPELTFSSFIPDPFSKTPGSRMYKTGDLGRFLPDGEMEYLGRIDHQVKIRGFRIELGEIETAILSLPKSYQTVVVAKEIKSGEKRLVAYVVSKDREILTIDELKKHLHEKLPDYMIPQYFVLLEKMPLTPNGKVNRKALPSPVIEREGTIGLASGSNTTEEVVAGIFCEVLAVNNIGINENFFEIGGHSLLATQIVSRIKETFKINLPLSAIFESPTVEKISERIKLQKKSGIVYQMPKTEIDFSNAYPLSYEQERLWFLEQLEPDQPTYNMPGMVRLTGKLNVEILEKVFEKLIERHSVLRTTFHSKSGKPLQKISDEIKPNFEFTDLSNLPENEKMLMTEKISSDEAKKLFDLENGPVVRFKLLKSDDANHILLVTMHHIISDGWSLEILFREVILLYESLIKDQPPALDPLQIEYVEYVLKQRELFKQNVFEEHLNYWRNQLSGIPVLLELPLDKPRPASQTFDGKIKRFRISTALEEQIKRVCREEKVTLFMLSLAVYSVLLSQFGNAKEIVVGSPIAGRNDKETEDLIGFFVNTLALRIDLEGNPNFRELLQRVKSTALEAYSHQEIPFEMLVEELKPARKINHSPVFQVMLVVQNKLGARAKFSELEIELLDTESETAKFDLTLGLYETEEGLNAEFEYNTNLFEPQTIDRFVKRFSVLMESALSDPNLTMSDFELLSDVDTETLVKGWNKHYKENQPQRSIFEAIENNFDESRRTNGNYFR